MYSAPVFGVYIVFFLLYDYVVFYIFFPELISLLYLLPLALGS